MVTTKQFSTFASGSVKSSDRRAITDRKTKILPGITRGVDDAPTALAPSPPRTTHRVDIRIAACVRARAVERRPDRTYNQTHDLVVRPRSGAHPPAYRLRQRREGICRDRHVVGWPARSDAVRHRGRVRRLAP